MATLSPDQRNYYYLLESGRTGIHQPILAALYQTHSIGDAIDFVCKGLIGNQLYWTLDPW